MEAAFFEERAREVMEKLEAAQDIDFFLVAVESSDQCRSAAEALPIDDDEGFVANCREAETSLSFTMSGEEFILLKTDKAFVQEDESALRGLMAHEMMHTVQRRQGVEQRIEDASKSHFDSAVAHLQERGFSDDEVYRFLHTVFETAIFTLKDIFANTELIRMSFVSDLEHYYYHMLGVEDFCPLPDFYGEEAELAEVENAIAFELGLLPAWLPFEALNRAEADDIRHRIKECYEKDIPQVAYYAHKVRNAYHDHYNDRVRFMNRFFQDVLEGSYAVIERKVEGRQKVDADE